MARFKINIIFLLIIYVVSISNLFAQEKDTIKLRKLFNKGLYFEKTIPDSAIFYFEKVITLTKTTPNQKIVAITYNRLACFIFEFKADVKKRFELNFKALKIFEAIHDSAGIAQLSENIGISLVEQRRHSEAILYHKLALSISKKIKLTSVIISSTMSIADCFSNISKTDSAIYYMKELENHFPVDASKTSLMMFYSNMGNTYYNLGETTTNKMYYKNAIDYAQKSTELCLNFKLEEIDLAFNYGLIGAANMALGNYSDSELNYLKAIEIFERKKENFDLNQMYFELTLLFINMGDKDKAQAYFLKHDKLSKLLYSEENSNSVSSMKTLFETEKKETENTFLQTQNNLSNKTIKQQKSISYFIIGGLLLVSFLAFFIFIGLKKQRQANKLISQQKILVEEKHREITDSINYAERIQRSFLATKSQLDENLKDFFIMFQPKDVVSGDFYWAHTLKNGNFALVTADSTGHGVPGAIMSLLNTSSLERAVELGITEPAEILNHTRKTIIDRLKKDGSAEGGKDGMDCSLISLDPSKTKLTYSAANNPIWIIKDYKIIELIANKMPVGKHDNDSISFTQHEIELKNGDLIYTLTDGFPDQFGGPKGKKFMYKKLKEVLINISQLPMKEQKEQLEIAFKNWKGDLEQVDDVTIIGIKV